MARDNGQGMFTMEFINEVASVRDLSLAKAKVTAQIDVSGATDTNKQAGMRLVHNSHSFKSLMLGLANFSLSHQGLKTLR